MSEEEAKERRKKLQELRDKFLVSRKHRLMGKPYQRPSKKSDSSRKESASKKPGSVTIAAGPGVMTVGPTSEVGAFTFNPPAELIQSIRPGGMAGLSPSLLQPPLGGMAGLPFGAFGASALLGHSVKSSVSKGLTEWPRRALAPKAPKGNPAMPPSGG